MTRKQRPADDRASDDLKTWEVPATDSNQPASCPLLSTIKLLPLRYGRTETPSPESESGLPYELASRPLGYRLLRDGYIYVLDEDAQAIHEYVHQDGELSGHNGGKLEYPKDHTLYVCFSDIALTERKKAQVLDSKDERAFFMQKIDLSSASPASGGMHLLTPEQAKLWVAEFAEDFQPEAPGGGYAQESEPYYWENQPYYHKTRFGKLIRQQDIEDPSDCLCLVLRDDVGVMLDLAQHQDDVVGWIEEWSKTDNNERNYVLGALIESLSTLSDEVLGGAAESTGNEVLQTLYEETTEPQRQAIYNYLDIRKDYRGPQPIGSESFLRENHGENPLVTAQLDMIESLGQELYAVHRDAINQLNLRNFHLLNGASLGQRGINDLIDRPAMSRFMGKQRARLSRWQTLLDSITDDRVTLLCDVRYHHATWYFDQWDEEQVEAALDLEMACLKDICRSDDAAEKVLDWIENYPQYARPLFQTLLKDQQSRNGELVKTYLSTSAAGYSIVTKAASWMDQIRSTESGKLPDINQLSERIGLKARAVGDILAPAVSMGIARSMEKLYAGIDRQNLPPLEDLFRDLPYFFKRQMLEAIEAGKAEFQIASAAEQSVFQENLTKMLSSSERLDELNKAHELAKKRDGHRSEKARAIRAEFIATREEHRAIGEKLAAALSPVEEMDTGLKLEPATTGRAGLTLVLPAIDQQELGRVVGHFRRGAASAPRVNLLGDGLGFIVFFAQLWNLWEVSKALGANPDRPAAVAAIYESLAGSTAAGFLAFQSLMDTAYSARAKQLADAWQRSTLKSVHMQMGRLHVGLGLFAYGAAVVGAAYSVKKHWGNWLDAIRKGNEGSQAAAVLGMAGSGGLFAYQSYGLIKTGQSFFRVLSVAGLEGKSSALVTAGRGLSGLFARMNIAGLIFTLFELGGSWLYNRYNLSERDQWLLTTPWTKVPAHYHDGALAEYEAGFTRLGSNITLDRERDGNRLLLNICHLPAAALTETLGNEPLYRLSLCAWRVHEGRAGNWSGAPEAWVRCTAPVLTSLEASSDTDHLQLTFLQPKHDKSRYNIMTREFVLTAKVETREPEGGYSAREYFFKLGTNTPFPVVPLRESPGDEPVWRLVEDPVIKMDVYQ